jgi:hypothetical protein
MTTKWFVAAGAAAALTLGLDIWIAAAQADDDSPTPPNTSIPHDSNHEHDGTQEQCETTQAAT